MRVPARPGLNASQLGMNEWSKLLCGLKAQLEGSGLVAQKVRKKAYWVFAGGFDRIERALTLHSTLVGRTRLTSAGLWTARRRSGRPLHVKYAGRRGIDISAHVISAKAKTR